MRTLNKIYYGCRAFYYLTVGYFSNHDEYKRHILALYLVKNHRDWVDKTLIIVREKNNDI